MNTAYERLKGLSQQLVGAAPSVATEVPSSGREKVLAKHADDIVITCALRTPLTKARKGGLKDTLADDLLISILKSIVDNSNIDRNLVEDVCVGNTLRPGASYMARSAVLAAGFPASTAASVVNRFCSSGLLAIQQISTAISCGVIDIGIAAGVESMSTNPDGGAPEPALSPAIQNHAMAKDNLQPMGWTSENVAGDFSISRESMDKFAADSFQKAQRAQEAGWFTDEIAPISVQYTDPKSGETRTITVDKDDGIRPNTTAEGLSKVRAAFPQWAPSHTTGGNASQITDGAAAVLLMKRSTAEKLGQTILAKLVQTTVVGLEPRIMGIGPYYAIPKLLEKTGLRKEDVDVFEINEAFASMGVYCTEKLELDMSKVNPRGGAIALGHPLGCTGVRQVVTALSELKRSKQDIAVTSMCVGTGMGMAGLFVRES